MDHAQVHINKRDALLKLMMDLKWHPHWEMKGYGGMRYSARLLELKRLGFKFVDRFCSDDTGGKEYRMLSTKPTQPKQKMVKVYLDEQDVEAMVYGETISERAHTALCAALDSFHNNKDKL